MIFQLPFMLFVYSNNLLVEEYVPMHGLFASSLHCFMEVRGDSLMSGLSLICFTKSFRDLGGEVLLDLLRFQVQKLNLFVYLGEFSTDYLDPRLQLIFYGYLFLGH